MDEDAILRRRIQAEASRRGDDEEVVRQRLIEEGLNAAKTLRDAEASAKALAADVVLVTATRTEHEELRGAAKGAGFQFEKRSGRLGTYYHLGTIGGQRVVSIQVKMGAFGQEGAAARCIHARAETKATLLILLGTAFGVSPQLQQVGDVLVSESVFLYDDRHAHDAAAGTGVAASFSRLASRLLPSGSSVARWFTRASGGRYVLRFPTARRPASPAWVERFQRLGEQLAREGDELRVTVGTMLSGGARIESGAYREELVGHVPALEPPIVGGEMEAMGAISAALTDPEEPGWIVVKGVADFADAESRAVIEQTRKVAARAAATVVLRALAEAGTLV